MGINSNSKLENLYHTKLIDGLNSSFGLKILQRSTIINMFLTSFTRFMHLTISYRLKLPQNQLEN